MISSLGKGAELGKIDIKQAFRLLIVNPTDFDLLGIQFEGKYWVDKNLPMTGILTIILTVSISNPKNVNKVVGPTVLLSARGTPSSWQMFLKTSINNAQFPDPLAPAKMKSI
jgi:hypothetical protein